MLSRLDWVLWYRSSKYLDNCSSSALRSLWLLSIAFRALSLDRNTSARVNNDWNCWMPCGAYIPQAIIFCNILLLFAKRNRLPTLLCKCLSIAPRNCFFDSAKMAFRSLQGFVVLFWVCLATTGVHASTNNGILETTSTSPAIDVSADSSAIKSLEIRATPTTPTSAGSTVLCGPQNGNLHCAPGLCCSGYGNCGIGDLYCQAENGCNAAFGQCGSFTSVFTPGPTGSTTLCGPANNNTICATGDCCSPAGFCGKGQ